MDAIDKELERVAAKVTTLYPTASSTPASAGPSSSRRKASSSKAKAASSASSSETVSESLDGLLSSLEAIHASLVAPGTAAPSPPVVVAETKSAISRSQKAVADRQKEVYNALAKLGKAYDKKFATPVDGIADPSLFMGGEAQKALEAVVLDHMLRMGESDAAEQLSRESGLPLPPSEVYVELEVISQALKDGDLQAAIRWAEDNREFLYSRSSHLEYYLHRSQFLRIAGRHLNTAPPPAESMAVDSATEGINVLVGGFSTSAGPKSRASTSSAEEALYYGRTHLRRYLRTHTLEVQALFTLLLFLPQARDTMSYSAGDGMSLDLPLTDCVPSKYHHFLDANQMHSAFLEPLFRIEYCARNKLARDAPLKTAVEVGASGALMKIMRVRQVMKMRGNEWSQADELPIDIPLPSHLRFHSTFTCPVSKEQATEENPPMMMACGHVVCAESLARLGKGHGRVKCPYCPTESTVAQATRIYF